MKLITVVGAVAAVVVVVAVVKGPDWHAPGVHGTQMGYRASSSVQFASRAEGVPINVDLPETLPPAATGGPKATEVYKNVKVLTDVSAAEFMRLQYAITARVSPKQRCGFCNEGTNWVSDAKPTQPIPAELWLPRQPAPVNLGVSKQEDTWNEAADTVTRFFPNNGYAEYYLQDHPAAGQSVTALRTNRVANTVVFNRLYQTMMQMSLQIGVNCGYCHNSRAWADWSQSSPYRWVGYYSLNMMRDLNRTYLLPFAQIIPQQRELIHETKVPVIPGFQAGQQSGNALLTCETCHYRLTKPLNGVNMVKDYPGLVGHEPDAKDSDPNIAITRASLAQMQKPDLAARELEVGAGN